MPVISNYKRLGIECELRKLCFNFNRLPSSGPRNKTVLAASAVKESVSGESSDSHPWVKAVMEGNDSGINIIELVFGPLPDSVLKNVMTVANIAANIDIKALRAVSGEKKEVTFADWITAFNKSLNPELKNFKLTADPRFSYLTMKSITGTSGSPSRQANLTVPVSVFADKWKLKNLTDGFKPFSCAIEDIPDMLRAELGKATPPFPPDPVAIGTLSLAVYFIALYATRGHSLNSTSVEKYLFHVLPKVDLGALAKMVFHSSDSGSNARKRIFIDKLLTTVCGKITAFATSPRAKEIKASVDLLLSHTFDSSTGVINPRPSGVLPIYTISTPKMPAIVVELRSGTLTLLREILEGHPPEAIWKIP